MSLFIHSGIQYTFWSHRGLHVPSAVESSSTDVSPRDQWCAATVAVVKDTVRVTSNSYLPYVLPTHIGHACVLKSWPYWPERFIKNNSFGPDMPGSLVILAHNFTGLDMLRMTKRVTPESAEARLGCWSVLTCRQLTFCVRVSGTTKDQSQSVSSLPVLPDEKVFFFNLVLLLVAK